YEFIDNWNIDASREDKVFKNGIIETNNGYELVWGLGEYGKHLYELQYTVTDFIKQVDGPEQILFWRYVNDELNTPPEKLTIEIETDKALTEENEKIWAFGFDGNIRFHEDGKVVAISYKPLKSKNYATVLLAFSDGLFQTSDQLDKTFEEIKDEAFKESDYQKSQRSLVSLLLPFFVFAIPFGIAIIAIIYFLRADRTLKRRRKYKEAYERELPFEAPFHHFYYLLSKMKTSKLEQLLSAFILKWIKEDRIDVEEEKTGIIFKSNDPVIYLLNKDMDGNDLENELFDMFLAAENKEGKIEKTDFSRWVEKNRSTMRTWDKEVKEQSLDTLKKLDIYQTKKKKILFFTKKSHVLTDFGAELEEAIFKYMNYLEDYALLNEHDAINVKLWDDIMIWAAMLGITEQVYKQFNALYPAYKDESIYTHSMISASHSYGRTISSASSYASSGGGGSVSGGGGGGSFGGGSGGGTR